MQHLNHNYIEVLIFSGFFNSIYMELKSFVTLKNFFTMTFDQFNAF